MSGQVGPYTPIVRAGDLLVVSGQVVSLVALTNTAELIAAAQDDPDSSPANGVPGEDDQDQVVVFEQR